MRELLLPVPGSDDPQELVDWVELALVTEERRRFSRSFLRARLRDALFVPDSQLEETIDFALQEVRKRQRSSPTAYPFVTKQGGINRMEDRDSLPYLFMLFVSRSPEFRSTAAGRQDAAVLFERVLAVAMREYLGSRASARRFGHPPRGDRSGNFLEDLEELERVMGVSRGPAIRPPQQNDGGVDCIAWIPFSDKRPAFLILLGQASIGLEWSTKGQDIVEEIWVGWLDFGTHPATCLGVPFLVPDEPRHWDRLKRSVKVFFDRMRIAELSHDQLGDLGGSLSEWIETELSSITRELT